MLFIFLIYFICFQSFKNITAEFTRTITKKEIVEEFVKGRIYYQAPQRIILKVIKPVNQWIVLEDTIMLIYYPNEQKAFRFHSKNPFSLPFFQAFVSVVTDDFGLPKVGFSLTKSEIKGDTLLTYWEPPKQIKKILGNTIIGLTKNKLLFVEIRDTKGRKLAKTTYSNHFQYGKNFFPLEITSVVYEKDSFTIEKVVYTNPQFNVPLPKEVVNFKIPDNIEIKEIEW
ncbi:MAG: hypothetical protein QXI58_07070 [Candidatus Micrarchaeia archaeon]